MWFYHSSFGMGPFSVMMVSSSARGQFRGLILTWTWKSLGFAAKEKRLKVFETYGSFFYVIAHNGLLVNPFIVYVTYYLFIYLFIYLLILVSTLLVFNAFFQLQFPAYILIHTLFMSVFYYSSDILITPVFLICFFISVVPFTYVIPLRLWATIIYWFRIWAIIWPLKNPNQLWHVAPLFYGTACFIIWLVSKNLFYKV